MSGAWPSADPAVRARWLLVAVTAAVAGLPVAFATLGAPGLPPTGSPLLPLSAGLVLLALQLRHSLAAADGRRPPYGPWTLLAVIALVYLPMFDLGARWWSAQPLVAASALMTLRPPLARIVAASPIAGMMIYVPIDDIVTYAHVAARVIVFDTVYWLVGLCSLTAVLCGVAWLVRTANGLRDTRTELAEVAIGQERLRVSRDLHDLLGQSLSAVSLKGELALRMLTRDPKTAQAEIESLTAIARDALHGVRAVTRGVHVMSLPAEIDSAARLLAAAGVDVDVDLDPATLDAAACDVFAWVVREAVTNLLRHSLASRCTISAHRRGDQTLLAIENDGAPTVSGAGTGLAGLADRARSRAGRLTAGPTGDGRFRVVVELPAVPA